MSQDNNQYQPCTQQAWRAQRAYNGQYATDAAHGGHISYAGAAGFVHTAYRLLAFPEPVKGPPPTHTAVGHVALSGTVMMTWH